jgi:putative oxidoreductase
MEVLFLIGRILYGGFFLYNAFNHFLNFKMVSGYAASKGVAAPGFAAIIGGILLFLGGVSMILGLFPYYGVLCLVLFLVPVSFRMHAFWAVEDPQAKAMEQVNFSKNMGLLGAALMMLVLGQNWPLGVQ